MSLLDRVLGRWRNHHYARGIQHFNRREFAAAIAEFQELLDEVHDPSNPDVELARFYWAEAHAKLGLAHFRVGEFGRAREEFQQAILVEGSFPDLYYYLGVLAAWENDSEDALALLDHALKLNPLFIEALSGRALVQESLGRSDAADADLRALSAQRVPVPEGVPWQLRLQVSVHALDELQPRAPGENSLSRAIEHYDQGALGKALESLEGAILESPGYADLRWRVGLLLAEVNRKEDAVAAFDEALAINPDFINALVARGICLLCLERPGDAARSLNHAADLRPRYADVAYYQAVANLNQGLAEEALTALTRAMEINPRFWRARFVMGQVHLVLGNRSRALQCLQEVFRNQPVLWSERQENRPLPGPRRSGGVLGYLSGILDNHPDYPDVRVQLGLALLGMGELDAARREFREAIRINPTYGQAHWNLGKTELLDGSPGAAIEPLRRALELDQGYADVHCLLAEAWLAMGRGDEAEASFTRALELNPRYIDALLGLACLRDREGKTAESRELYRKALEIDPGHPAASNRLGSSGEGG